jgi:P-type Mg2+ transporter
VISSGKEGIVPKTTLAQEVSGDRQEVAFQADTTLVTLPRLYKQLQTSEAGLTTAEARKRLSQSGPNDPTAVRRTSTLQQLLTFVANPLVVILLIASIVSATLGEVVNASIIILMVLLSIALNFFQTFRSQRAVERLRAGVALTSTVLRDGQWVELPRRELVPGDIIRLRVGDLVPADARLPESCELRQVKYLRNGRLLFPL